MLDNIDIKIVDNGFMVRCYYKRPAPMSNEIYPAFEEPKEMVFGSKEEVVSFVSSVLGASGSKETVLGKGPAPFGDPMGYNGSK